MGGSIINSKQNKTKQNKKQIRFLFHVPSLKQNKFETFLKINLKNLYPCLHDATKKRNIQMIKTERKVPLSVPKIFHLAQEHFLTANNNHFSVEL